MVGERAQTILTLAFPYAGILVFSAFGPVLTRLLPLSQATGMGVGFLLILGGAMIPSPGKKLPFERRPGYLQILVVVTAISVGLFGFVRFWFQVAALLISAVGFGRIAAFWSRHFLATVSTENRGRTMGLALSVAYGILYLFNVVSPELPASVLTPLVALLVLATVPTSYGLSRETILAFSAEDGRLPEGCGGRGLPFLPLSVIFMVYVVAGFTYTAILPTLASVPIDQYFNVLPFVLVVGAAGLLTDHQGRIPLLYGGIGFLGLSLVAFQLPSGPLWYLGTQSLVQIAWALLDLFVWVWAADLVFCYRNDRMQNLGVASFLFGTSVGAATTGAVYDALMEQEGYFLFAIPLFLAVTLLGNAARREPDMPQRNTELTLFPEELAKDLTSREMEVALHLANRRSNREILDALHISQNTLKTHCRNIYRKLNVRNRQELQTLVSRHD